MRTIGITGGVGAGKSTVLAFLEREYGAYVIQADLVGHQVMEPGEMCYAPVVGLFGNSIIKNDKTLDRKMISDVVFSEPDKREKLNAIIHPAVKRYILESLAAQRAAGRKLCVVEAALLLEDRYQDFCDEVWYVHVDKEIRVSRLMDSRGYTRKKALDIIKSQATEDFFYAHADRVIENNSNPEETYRQVREGIEKHEIL